MTPVTLERLEKLRTDLIEASVPIHSILEIIVDEMKGLSSEEKDCRTVWLTKELSGYAPNEEPDAYLPQFVPRACAEQYTFGKGGKGYRVQKGVINQKEVIVFDNKMAISKIEDFVRVLDPAPQVVYDLGDEIWTSDAKDFVYTLLKIRVVVLDLIDTILAEFGKDPNLMNCPDFGFFMKRDLIDKPMPPSNLPEPEEYDWDFPALEKAIEIYSSIGLFMGQKAEEVIQEFKDHIEEYSDGEMTMKPDYQVVEVLNFSKSGVWCGDPERNVGEGNFVYVDLLEEWERISFGAFEPKMIDEEWEAEYGPISLRFELNGEKREIHPKYLNDWADLRILNQINQYIVPSGRQFERAEFGNWAIVLCLKPHEKSLLIEELKFPFQK